ncbi:SPOR domain-containing protein [Bartonella sp. F02]|uniref:SPOR domain-containing protein n=1 Tax=Bartonella sp. F02 TaxID=2967262 RepID=UPI0022A9112C|nr:SPOR domain-containing protein [Bartonella sp. F02]MCZ2328170.1 SPOR domain-containing protein [Bartonella sp. F02]
MSDNDRKNPYKTQQDHDHHDPLEELTRVFDSNKKNESPTSSSSSNSDGLSQTSDTPFQDDFDLSFLESDFENDSNRELPFGDNSQQWNLQSTISDPVLMDVATTSVLNHSKQNNFLSETTYSSSINHNEEKILDALSPLPIQKNHPQQEKIDQKNIDPFLEKDHFNIKSRNDFLNEETVQNNAILTESQHEQTDSFLQKDIQQYSTLNTQSNDDSKQNIFNPSVNTQNTTSIGQQNSREDYYTNTLKSSMDIDSYFSLSSNENDITQNEPIDSFTSHLNSSQIDNLFDFNDLSKEESFAHYSQLDAQESLKQPTDTTKNLKDNSIQVQHAQTDTHYIPQQNNEDQYNQNHLNYTQDSSQSFNDRQTEGFTAHNNLHDENFLPEVDTYKFAEEIVEKTEPVLTSEVPYEEPQYGMPDDSLKKEFSDVFNVGYLSARNSTHKQNNEYFDETAHQAEKNSEENLHKNTQEYSVNASSTHNDGYYDSLFNENAHYQSENETLTNPLPPSAPKSFFVRKTSMRGIILFAILAIVFLGYSRFFTSSHKNGELPIIHADTTPFRIKPEKDEPENNIVDNLDIYKRMSENNEKEKNTQQFLIDNFETPEDLTELHDQETENILSLSSDESDIEDAVTAALDHTIPTREVQTVIVKPDGTTMLIPAHNRNQKSEGRFEENDKMLVDQIQNQTSISSSSTENEPTTDIDRIISENSSISDIKEKMQHLVVPIPSPYRLNSKTHIHSSSPQNLGTQTTQQNSEIYYVQVASQPTHILAETSLKNIQSKFDFLIGVRSLNIQPAFISGKGTYYRVRIETHNRNEAINLCQEIKSYGGNCFVTR